MSIVLFLIGFLVLAYSAQSCFLAPRLVNGWQSQGAQLSVPEALYVSSAAAVASFWWLGILVGLACIVAATAVWTLGREERSIA